MNKLIIIAGAVVLSLVLGLTMLWPKYQKLQILWSDITINELDLQSKENYLSQIKEVSLQLKQYQEPLAKISSALPQDSSLPSLVNFFQSSAAKSGLILEKISWIEAIAPEGKSALKETQLTFQLAGSYEALKNFLSVLESSARIIEVQKVFISIPKKESKESPSFNIDVKAYSY